MYSLLETNFITMIVLPFGIIFMIRTTIPFGERLVMKGDFMGTPEETNISVLLG
jgi:hypothetical protein